MAADLQDSIDWSGTFCLNALPAHPISNAIKQVFLRFLKATERVSQRSRGSAFMQGYREDNGMFVESDTDEQLLIQITFNMAVKLNSLVVKGTDTEGKAPRRVKLFINRPSIGFSEAESEPAVQEFELEQKHLEGEPVQLRYVKFQSVNSLNIFVVNNQGDEETTQIQKIALYGTPKDTFNVSGVVLDSVAQAPADAIQAWYRPSLSFAWFGEVLKDHTGSL
eukprot:jgi/Astpho2/3441/Aster-07041